MRKIIGWFPLLLFGILCLVLTIALLTAEEKASIGMEKPMPNFRLAELGKPQLFYSEKELRGEFFILNFWATWCPPCRQEFPVLMAVAQEYDVKWVGINYKDNAATAEAWLKELGNPYLLVLADQDGRAGIEWGIIAVPETFLVDKQGIIRYKHTGPITTDIWEKEIWPQVCYWSDNTFPRCKELQAN